MTAIKFKIIEGGIDVIPQNKHDIGICIRVKNKYSEVEVDDIINEYIIWCNLSFMEIKTKTIAHKKYSKYKHVAFTMSYPEYKN